MRADVFDREKFPFDIEHADGDAGFRILDNALLTGRQFVGPTDDDSPARSRFGRFGFVQYAKGIVKGWVFGRVAREVVKPNDSPSRFVLRRRSRKPILFPAASPSFRQAAADRTVRRRYRRRYGVLSRIVKGLQNAVWIIEIPVREIGSVNRRFLGRVPCPAFAPNGPGSRVLRAAAFPCGRACGCSATAAL